MAKSPQSNKPQDEETDVTANVSSDAGDASGNDATPVQENVMPQETKTTSPPPGVYVEDLVTDADLARAIERAPGRTVPAPGFTDQYVGVGGRFRVNPDTGVREPIWEAYTDDNGVKQYREAV